MPWDIDTILVGETSCGSNNGYVSVITNGSFNNPPQYTWHGPGANNPNFIDASVWTDLPVGWYYIEITSAGCTRYDSAFVTPLNPPVAAVSASITSGCSPLTVTFTNSSQNASTFDWIFGDGQTASTSDVQTTQTHTFLTSSTIQLVAIQSNCSDTATVDVNVLTCGCTDPNALNYDPAANSDNGSCVYAIPPKPTVETYNVFSPGSNDDTNPTFYVKATNAEHIELTIVNRWGNKVFEGSGSNPVWDGKVDGKNADDGVYFYTYKVVGLNGEILEGQGFVHLFR
jgi:gliding motility-associated-like protein